MTVPLIRKNVTDLPIGEQRRRRIIEAGFSSVTLIGSPDALQQPLVRLLCSTKCPGGVILKTYDAAKALRDASVTVAGGFHSPMEQECRRLLQRARQPVIWCPARSVEQMRLSREDRSLINDRRLLVLSPFSPRQSRMTAKLANERNRFLAALCQPIFVPYASLGGLVLSLCEVVLAQGGTVWTLESDENESLVDLGAIPVTEQTISRIAAGLADSGQG